MEEIPTALRDKSKQSKGKNKWSKRKNISPDKIVIWLIVGLLTVFVVSTIVRLVENNGSNSSVVVRETENNPPSPPKIDISENNNQLPEPPREIVDNILGHLAYEEAPLEELRPITADGRIKLRAKAAEKYNQMVADARSQGIILVAISGFRAVSEQEYLFFEVKEQRNQIASQRAEVSAPPGYSEHHTGYAVDIGDGNNPDSNLQESFENTPAYDWLDRNAPRYSFELSFPRDNVQGISYEPWHWRFVGDSHSLKTFYKARELQSNPLD